MTTTTNSATVTLPTATQILITRRFDAPAAHVWKAWTTPELVRRWWPGSHGEMSHCEIDLRVGGRWRFALASGPDFSGEYRELVPERRIVSTEVYAPLPDFVAVNTLTLEERDGGTLLTVLVQHATQEARDGHLNAGMEGGMQESLDALEQVSASLVG